jgi:hypothetical protein
MTSALMTITLPITSLALDFFSLRFIRGFFAAMNSSVALLGLVQVADLNTLIDGSLAVIVLQPIY